MAIIQQVSEGILAKSFGVTTSISHYLVENGMLRHSLGGAVMFFSFQYFIAPALDLIAVLALPTKEGGNKGIKSKKEAIKSC